MSYHTVVKLVSATTEEGGGWRGKRGQEGEGREWEGIGWEKCAEWKGGVKRDILE